MSPGWTAVIGVSLALMAIVQLAVLVGSFIAFRRTQAQLKTLQDRVQAAIDEIRPEVMAALAEARTVTASMQTLASDMRGRLDAVDEATRNARDRVTRVVDTVQWAASTLPVPVKVSGPAAVVAWAGARVARNLIDRARRRSSASKPSRRAPTDYPQL